MDYIRALIGLIVLTGIAYLLSGNRKKVDWRLVAVGIGLQVAIALLIAYVPFIKTGFDAVSRGFVTFLSFALDGAGFLFCTKRT